MLHVDLLCVCLETNEVYFQLHSTFPRGVEKQAFFFSRNRKLPTFHYGVEQLALLFVI